MFEARVFSRLVGWRDGPCYQRRIQALTLRVCVEAVIHTQTIIMS